MRRSYQLIGVGVVLVCIGLGSLPELAKSTAKNDPMPETRASTPTVSPTTEKLTATNTPEPVQTSMPNTPTVTPTNVVFPTYPTVEVDVMLTNQNSYHDNFMNTSSGWEPYYQGVSGAWNGYSTNGYNFQLSNDASQFAGRRLWDFNTCCVLDAKYSITLDAQSQVPQRGMVITDYMGDFVNMDRSSGYVVLFDVGYNGQQRLRALQVAVLEQGNLFGLNCTGDTALSVGQRMKTSVTIVDRLLLVSLTNNDTKEHIKLRCGLFDRPSGRKILGIGAVRADNTNALPFAPLVYTNLDIVGINNVMTENIPVAERYMITAGCNNQPVSTFEQWLYEDIMHACATY